MRPLLLDKLKRDWMLDPSLVLYLPLHRLDGASFKDETAYGHLATVTGALWKPDGYYFDGSDDVITIPYATCLNPTVELTVEAWFKTNDYTEAQGIADVLDDTTGYSLLFFSSALTGLMRPNDPATFTADASWNGRWVHGGFTFSAAGTVLFVNGQVVATAAYSAAASVSTRDLIVGNRAYYSPATSSFNGSIGEVRIYNRALTLLEIQRNYLATKWRYR